MVKNSNPPPQKTRPKLLVHSDDFSKLLGRFHLVWNAIEFETAFVVGRLIPLSYEETHILTTRMPFNVKASLLRAMLARRKPEGTKEMLTALKIIQNESKRNAFAHSFLIANEQSVTFFDRSVERSELITRSHPFTLTEFDTHVANLAVAGRAFADAACISQEDLDAFARAALSLNTRS